MAAQDAQMNTTHFLQTKGISGELLLQDDLAKRWRTSVRTLARWRATGCGPAYIRIGGQIRYRLSDVLTFEDRMRRDGANAE